MFKLLAVLCMIDGTCQTLVDSRGITYLTEAQCEVASKQRFDAVTKDIFETGEVRSITIGCVDADFIPDQD